MTQTRADRLNAIVEYLYQCGRAGATKRDIRLHLGLKQTPYLDLLISEVIEAKCARSEREWIDGGKVPVLRYFYRADWQSDNQYPLSADDYGP